MRFIWPLALLSLVAALAGCTGNYRFNDDEYRLLGEPSVVNLAP